MDEMERRTITVELRVVAPALGKKSPTITGYAAKFNTLSSPMPIIREGKKIGTFREQLLPGCFAAALGTSDPRCLINHDPNLILGRKSSGTLRLVEDEIGLRFENDPPKTSYSTDIQDSMTRGDVNQCSFGFNVAEGGDSYVKDPNVAGGYIRSINNVEKLFDVSPVTYPAYDDTNCAVRSIVGKLQDEEEKVAKAIKQEEEDEIQRNNNFKRRQLELAEISV